MFFFNYSYPPVCSAVLPRVHVRDPGYDSVGELGRGPADGNGRSHRGSYRIFPSLNRFASLHFSPIPKNHAIADHFFLPFILLLPPPLPVLLLPVCPTPTLNGEESLLVPTQEQGERLRAPAVELSSWAPLPARNVPISPPPPPQEEEDQRRRQKSRSSCCCTCCCRRRRRNCSSSSGTLLSLFSFHFAAAPTP